MKVTVRLGWVGSGGDSLAGWLGVDKRDPAARWVSSTNVVLLIEAATLREVFGKLSEHRVEAKEVFARMIDDAGRLRGRFLTVELNGKYVEQGQSVDTPLRDGDEIHLTSPACALFLGVIAKGLKPANQ